jgi:hypothetical protein
MIKGSEDHVNHCGYLYKAIYKLYSLKLDLQVEGSALVVYGQNYRIFITLYMGRTLEIPVPWDIQQNDSLRLSSSVICMSLRMYGVISCFGDVSCYHQWTSFHAMFCTTLKHIVCCLYEYIIPVTVSKIFNV